MVDQLDELPPNTVGGTTFLKTCFNGVNALSGIGIITLPYALSQGGWLSIILLCVVAIVTCYAGVLLQRCMDSSDLIKTYSDVGWTAFGKPGRIIVSTFMYLELYLVPTGFLILEGDNLHKLYPNINFDIRGHYVGGKQFFTIVVGLVILPSMWLTDLSVLSFVSAAGVLSFLIIIGSIFWVGAFDGVGFHGEGKLFNLSGTPTALSLYAFSYGALPVFPTLYNSMKDKSQFSKVLLVSFALTTLCYMSMAVLGYSMFGQNVQSQVTLNLPATKISSKIAIYTTLASPITKYALAMTPIAEAIERSLPRRYNFRPISILLRTLLLVSTVIVALVFPHFGLLTTLIGAILNVTGAVLLPCACYLKISGVYRRWGFEALLIMGIIIMAVFVAVTGTYSSVKEIIRQF